ncbi:hypothetical protein KKF55_02880 [Patescibacteria group bacterium]|nr:hypothetical protein [Patescibacteria group bacterium]
MIKIVETDERLKRKWCTFNGGVEELRREGYSVHADILDPLVQKAAANGRLEHLSLLYGPKLSHHLLRTCMEAARTKRDMEVALECAQMLRDYQVIAEILSISGTPHQMITAQLFLEGRVSEEELL